MSSRTSTSLEDGAASHRRLCPGFETERSEIFLNCLALVAPFIPFLILWTGMSGTVILGLSYLHIWEKTTGSRFTDGEKVCFRNHTQILTHTYLRWLKWDLEFLRGWNSDITFEVDAVMVWDFWAPLDEVTLFGIDVNSEVGVNW